MSQWSTFRNERATPTVGEISAVYAYQRPFGSRRGSIKRLVSLSRPAVFSGRFLPGHYFA